MGREDLVHVLKVVDDVFLVEEMRDRPKLSQLDSKEECEASEECQEENGRIESSSHAEGLFLGEW